MNNNSPLSSAALRVPATKPMTKAQATKFIAALAKGNPSPTTELKYGNNYQLLVAVVLSAQSTDKGVNLATKKLFEKISKPSEMVKLKESGLVRRIRSIGLYRNKAKNIIALSRQLLDKHDGKVPSTRKDLEALPGVGRKTANVILNTAFGEPTLAVDTHIFRIGNRTGIAPGKTPLAVEEKLLEVIPKKYLQHAHHWLILHGRYVCIARKPKCSDCVAKKHCLYENKNESN